MTEYSPTGFASLVYCRSIGISHEMLKEAIDLEGIYKEDEFGGVTPAEEADLPEVYAAIAKDFKWKKSPPYNDFPSGFKYLFDNSGVVLQRYGWPEKLLPNFDNLDLPKVNKTRLRVEGRLVKILKESDNPIEYEALANGDTAEYQKILQLTEGKIDRKTVTKILDRWNLRPMQSKSSPTSKS